MTYYTGLLARWHSKAEKNCGRSGQPSARRSSVAIAKLVFGTATLNGVVVRETCFD